MCWTNNGPLFFQPPQGVPLGQGQPFQHQVLDGHFVPDCLGPGLAAGYLAGDDLAKVEAQIWQLERHSGFVMLVWGKKGKYLGKFWMLGFVFSGEYVQFTL